MMILLYLPLLQWLLWVHHRHHHRRYDHPQKEEEEEVEDKEIEKEEQVEAEQETVYDRKERKSLKKSSWRLQMKKNNLPGKRYDPDDVSEQRKE